MKRKLVKQGAATLMVSLPSKWIKENNLGKGDEVEVEEAGRELILSTKELAKGRQEVTIKISEENKQNIKNILTHLYRRGFDRIVLENIDVILLKEIRAITNNLLLGFELTQREGKKCIIENISEPLEQKYEIMLKKVFSIIQETQSIVLNDFQQGKFQNIEEIEEIRNQQDKFILFCRRLLIREKNNNLLEWELLTFLMHIEHSYYYMYSYALENKIKTDKEIIILLKELNNYFSLFYDAYYKKEIECVNKINKLKTKYQFGECFKALEKAKGKEIVIFSYIREIFRLIQIGTSPILAEILEKTNQSISV